MISKRTSPALLPVRGTHSSKTRGGAHKVPV
jgi:hypothetical protein